MYCRLYEEFSESDLSVVEFALATKKLNVHNWSWWPSSEVLNENLCLNARAQGQGLRLWELGGEQNGWNKAPEVTSQLDRGLGNKGKECSLVVKEAIFCEQYFWESIDFSLQLYSVVCI